MRRILLYTLLLFILASCERVLDKRDLTAIDGQDVWNDPDLAVLFLNRTYEYALPSFGGSSNTNISDESLGTGTGDMMYGLLTKDAIYGNYSSAAWYVIRQVNTLIEGLAGGSMAQEDKEPILGQAYFLRAWTYWELVKYYGGVPLVLNVQDPQEDEGLLVERESAHACINTIVDDLNQAIAYLPDNWTAEKGRATSVAAAALKGRVLLYYASPQFNPDNELSRWEDAYVANSNALTLAEEAGHQLYPDFANIFLDKTGSTEGIFMTLYNQTDKYHGYETSVRPRSVSNSQTTLSSAPNWEMVKSFPMSDGRSIDEHPGYDSVYYWLNRDPRFYATIGYNGMVWDFDESVGRIQWSYLGNTVEPSNTSQGATPTGFYLKKNVNSSVPKTESPYGSTDWLEIRLGEVYLNLAECAAETDRLTEAKQLLMDIRDRAGIENLDGNYGISATTKDQMVEAVMLERKIELAFENKRHWDLRRRNMFIEGIENTPKVNGSIRHGLEIDLDTAYVMSISPGVGADSVYEHFELVIMDTLDLDQYYADFFITTTVDLDAQPINYLQPEYNFYYVPTDEMQKNTNLKQTIYWTDVDPFDPLADR